MLRARGILCDLAQLPTGPFPANEPPIGFCSDPKQVREVPEGERLDFGQLFNPTIAVETALIDLLLHQRIAVYQHLLSQTRICFLLADDAMAGKIIRAVLYLRVMLARRLIRRVLVVPPARQVGNWLIKICRKSNRSTEPPNQMLRLFAFRAFDLLAHLVHHFLSCLACILDLAGK